MNVVLLATGRLPLSYFTTVRSDLGDDPGLELDVIAWSPPREPLDSTVRTYLLLGPGRMPVAPPPAEAAPAQNGPVPSTPAVAAAPAGSEPTAAAAAAPAPAPARRTARPAWSPRRVAGGVKRRAKGVVRLLKKSPAMTKLRQVRTDEIAREYWSRLRAREDALAVIRSADIVIALDSRSVKAGWHLARRPGAPTVVLGVQAAVRERAVAAARR